MEKINGHRARRTRGSMIPYAADAEDPKEQADGALRTLCDRADGATCKGAGGCIDVLVAAGDYTSREDSVGVHA